jgi:hypothetical protein
MEPIILHTFKMPVTICLQDLQRQEALKLLNLHYVQDEQCNEYKDGKLVSKYPEFEKEHPEFMEAHYAAWRSYVGHTIDVHLLSDGRLRLKNEQTI